MFPEDTIRVLILQSLSSKEAMPAAFQATETRGAAHMYGVCKKYLIPIVSFKKSYLEKRLNFLSFIVWMI